jgi:hypothetical protein
MAKKFTSIDERDYSVLEQKKPVIALSAIYGRTVTYRTMPMG